MNALPPEPTADQLQAMAYVDGELEPDERSAFEARLSKEPALGREVAELRRLELLARRMAPPEPADYEWQRLARDTIQRGGTGLGFALLIVGAAGLVGGGLATFLMSDESLTTKALVSALALGILALFGTTLRARLRVLPYDPYTQVER